MEVLRLEDLDLASQEHERIGPVVRQVPLVVGRCHAEISPSLVFKGCDRRIQAGTVLPRVFTSLQEGQQILLHGLTPLNTPGFPLT